MLRLDGQIVADFTLATDSRTYSHHHDGGAEVALVEFTNDGRTAGGADRNVIVDSFRFAGQSFDPATVRSQGVWNGTDCGVGRRNSRYLACNGWFEFPVHATGGTSGSTSGGGSGSVPAAPGTFSVRLRGTTGSERVTIEVDGVTGAPFTVGTGWQTVTAQVDRSAATIKVNFVNDGVVGGADRNLIVDWLEYGGTRSTAGQLMAKGVWDGRRCDVAARHGTGFLACNGWIELRLGS